MFGLLAAFGNLGGILMPWLVGVTSDWSSLRLGLATSTACPLLMAFAFVEAEPSCCKLARKSPGRASRLRRLELTSNPDRTGGD